MRAVKAMHPLALNGGGGCVVLKKPCDHRQVRAGLFISSYQMFTGESTASYGHTSVGKSKEDFSAEEETRARGDSIIIVLSFK
jgi:hypothetical protein